MKAKRPSRQRTERSRWVQIFLLTQPDENNASGYAKQQHRELRAVVHAFEQVGRVVRVESGGGNALVFKARKS